MALPKKRRVKKKKELEVIFKKGLGFRNDFFLLKCLPNSLQFHRSAVIVPLAVSLEAAERNKIKRTVNEALRNLWKETPWRQSTQKEKYKDCAIVVQRELKEKNFQEITDSLRDILKKANIV